MIDIPPDNVICSYFTCCCTSRSSAAAELLSFFPSLLLPYTSHARQISKLGNAQYASITMFSYFMRHSSFYRSYLYIIAYSTLLLKENKSR